MFGGNNHIPPPPSTNRQRNSSVAAALSSYRNRPKGSNLAFDSNSFDSMDFEKARKLFYAPKQQDITLKVKNAMNDSKSQKVFCNPHLQSASITLAKNSMVRSTLLNSIPSNVNNNTSSTTNSIKTQNVEEIARLFENQSFIESNESSSKFSLNNSTKPSTFPLLSNESFNHSKLTQMSNSNKIVNNSTNQTTFNSSFANPIFSIKKMAPVRPPPPKKIMVGQSNPKILSCSKKSHFSPPLVTNEPHAIVRYPYKAANSNELSCEPEDCVILKSEVNDHWIYATNTCTGKSGIVPLLFLNIKVPLAPTQSSNNILSINQRNRQFLNKFIEAKALYDYDTGVDGDLKFKKGDLIAVVSRVNSDWLHGELKSKSGIFPLNYVEFKNYNDLKQLNKEETGSSSFNTNENLYLNSDKLTDTNYITAAFDYNSGVSGDLVFNAGDQIEILKYHANSQWVTGRLKNTNQTGLVPLTYTHPQNC